MTGALERLLPLAALGTLAGSALLLFATLAVFAALFGAFATQESEGLVCSVSPHAKSGIPPGYLRLYQEAGERFGLDWAVLAAIGYIESGHGVNVGPSSAGALGPMQFLPGTWRTYGIDGNGDGRRDIRDPADAIPGAARLLEANGAPANWRRAIFAYNHADWYVRDVLAQADVYRGACELDPGADLGDGRLAWPVRGSLTSPFCERRAWERCHPGIDVGVRSGTPVLAAAAGAVSLARPVSGYGNYVCVTHTRRLTTCYAHLSEYRTARGAHVERGEVLGLSGCTGRCFGSHVHFEVRRGGTRGRPVDPLPYLEART